MLSFFFLFAFPSYLKAMELNCTSESMLLFTNLAYGNAYMRYYNYVIDQWYTEEANDICSWSNMTMGATSHWTININLKTAGDDEFPKALESKCKYAGGIVAKATYDVGVMGTNFTYYKDMGLDPAAFYVVDFSVMDDIVCVGPTACKNSTDVGEFIKYGWALYTGVDVYNFTLHNVTWGNTTYQR
jgi:hypothetical protein